MNDLGLWFLVLLNAKAALLAIAALVVIGLLKRYSVRQRHALLKLTLVALLALPLLTWLMPLVRFNISVSVPALPVAFSEAAAPVTPEAGPVSDAPQGATSKESRNIPNMDAVTETTPGAAVNGWQVALSFYLAVVVLLLLRYGLLVHRAQREIAVCPSVADRRLNETLQRLCRRVDISREVTLLLNRDNTTPFVWGLRRAVIVLPRDFPTWSGEMQASTLLHELVHIRKGDLFYGWLSKLCACVYWPNPLVWKITSQLNLEAEKACDEVVVSHVACAERYADHLVQIAKRLCSPAGNIETLVPTIVGEPSLTQRVRSILAADQRRNSMNKISIALLSSLLLGISLFSFAIESEQSSTPYNIAESRATPTYAVLNRAHPVYPKEAVANKIEGYVVVEFDITSAGTVENIAVIDSSPSPIFDQAAIAAVGEWLYLPTYVGGRAQRTEGVRTKLTFALGSTAGQESPKGEVSIQEAGSENGKQVVFYHNGRPLEEAELYEFAAKLKVSDLSDEEFKQFTTALHKAAASAETGNAYLALGRLYEAKEHWPQAQLALAKAFEKGELADRFAARFMVARVLYHTNRLADSKRVLQSLLDVNGANTEVKNWLAIVDHEAARRDLVAGHLVESAL